MSLFRKEVFIVVVVFSLGLILVDRFTGSSDEDLIKELLDQIEVQIEHAEPIKPLQIVSKLKALDKLTTQNLSIRTINDGKERTYSNKGEMKANAAPASQIFSRLALNRSKLSIIVNANQAKASFEVITEGSGRGGEEFRELFWIDATVEKDPKGNWLINSVSAERRTPR